MTFEVVSLGQPGAGCVDPREVHPHWCFGCGGRRDFAALECQSLATVPRCGCGVAGWRYFQPRYVLAPMWRTPFAQVLFLGGPWHERLYTMRAPLPEGWVVPTSGWGDRRWGPGRWFYTLERFKAPAVLRGPLPVFPVYMHESYHGPGRWR